LKIYNEQLLKPEVKSGAPDKWKLQIT